MDVRMMVRAALFAALTAVGAFIRIPIGDLSVTLQVMFSLMAGLILKEKWGSISQIMYILCGLVGIPVFTGGGGPQYVLQPSFGFIMGLVLLAYISWKICKKKFFYKKLYYRMRFGFASTLCDRSAVYVYCDEFLYGERCFIFAYNGLGDARISSF